MKIAMCNGGLGNQVFQYIFSRFVELESGEECYLDDSAFCRANPEHNGYEIEKVFPNAKPRLLSRFFSDDVWKYMMQEWENGTRICQQIKNSGEDIVMVAETDDYSFDGTVITVPTNQFLPRLSASKGNIYFHGYWIDRDWLKSNFYDILRSELSFAPLTEEHNIKYAELMAACNSVSLHIRRGDFVKYHCELAPEVYKNAIMYTEKQVNNAFYFVFSDDLQWCTEHAGELGLDMISGRVCFVQGNTGKQNFRDMQLMTLCKTNILLGNSSFSYLAALLNSNVDGMVINGSTRQV